MRNLLSKPKAVLRSSIGGHRQPSLCNHHHHHERFSWPPCANLCRPCVACMHRGCNSHGLCHASLPLCVFYTFTLFQRFGISNLYGVSHSSVSRPHTLKPSATERHVRDLPELDVDHNRNADEKRFVGKDMSGAHQRIASDRHIK